MLVHTYVCIYILSTTCIHLNAAFTVPVCTYVRTYVHTGTVRTYVRSLDVHSTYMVHEG